MLYVKRLITALSLSVAAIGYAQVPPIDNIIIGEPRIMDVTDTGAGYSLADGPQASAQLSLTQGAAGQIVGAITITDKFAVVHGPITLAGGVRCNGTKPLTMRLSGSLPGGTKVKITGAYDAPIRKMNLTVRFNVPAGLKYQWNDSFVPHINAVGVAIIRNAVVTNIAGVISGTHDVFPTGAPNFNVATLDTQTKNSGYTVKGGGVQVSGTFISASNTLPVSSASIDLGYGRIFTPGSLVHVTSGFGFVRN